jgi:hypothetical protein
MKTKTKNPAAVALGARRWYGSTPEERIEFATWVASQGAGRPRNLKVKRCPCGKMTLKTAKQRGGKRGTSPGHEPGCKFYLAPAQEVA